MTSKEWFTVLAMIDRIKHDQEIIEVTLNTLIETLVRSGALSRYEAERIAETSAFVRDPSRVDQIAEQTEALPVVDTIPDSGVSPQETVGDSLETTFTDILIAAMHKYETEGGRSGETSTD